MSATATATMNANAKTSAKNGSGDGFTELVIDFPSFKAEAFSQRIEGTQDEKYTGLPVQGKLLGAATFQMVDDKTGEVRDQVGYVIELTAPCKGFDRGATVARDVAKGEQIRVWQTAMLKQAIPYEVANHPTQLLNIRITPTLRKPFKNDQKMWHYKIETGAVETRSAANTNAISQMLASLHAQPSLGEG